MCVCGDNQAGDSKSDLRKSETSVSCLQSFQYMGPCVHVREQMNSLEGRNWFLAPIKSLQRWPHIICADLKLFSMPPDTQVGSVLS